MNTKKKPVLLVVLTAVVLIAGLLLWMNRTWFHRSRYEGVLTMNLSGSTGTKFIASYFTGCHQTVNTNVLPLDSDNHQSILVRTPEVRRQHNPGDGTARRRAGDVNHSESGTQRHPD